MNLILTIIFGFIIIAIGSFVIGLKVGYAKSYSRTCKMLTILSGKITDKDILKELLNLIEYPEIKKE